MTIHQYLVTGGWIITGRLPEGYGVKRKRGGQWEYAEFKVPRGAEARS